jgi:hypothetical protein
MGWIGVGITALGAIGEARQQEHALKRNRTILGYKMNYDQAISKIQKSQLAGQYRLAVGRGNLANAASGFDASSESSLRAVEAITKQAELDAMSIDLASEIKAWSDKAELAGYGNAIDNVKSAAFFKVGSTVADYGARQSLRNPYLSYNSGVY